LQERQTFTSWDRAWAFIRADQQYAGVDVERVHREYQEEMMRRGWMAAGPAGTELRASGVPGSAAYVRERAEALDEALISRVQRNVSLWERDVAARASRRISGFWDIPWGNVGKGVAALALSSLVVAGGIVLSGRGKPKLPPSLRTVSYEKWLASQGQFYGNRDLQETGSEGMSVGGISEFQRRALTDFGSPYRGPWGSNQVLTDQALLQERERYLREVYGVTHFDPVSGIFSGIRNLYSFSGRVLHRYIREGARPANAADFGLRGTGLFQIDLSKGDWQVTAEDADTIVVKKGGVPGLLHSLLGGNKGFAFRLAGIDSPEVYHPGRWRTPQPYAEEGRDAFRAMIEAGNLQLVFQPSEITYGRQLGVLFGAGKDLNKELVRRGLAASLPFKTTNQPMANYAAIGGIESRAFANQRGMWSQPFWQAYHDVAETFGERITFNTLANAGSLAKNATLMSTASLMWAAQDMGMYSTADQIAATELGRRMREVGIKGDYLDPVIIARSAVPSQNDHMLRLMSELQDYTRTSGENRNSWIKKRGGFRNLDKTLVLDSLGTTNKVWQKPRYEAYEIYGTELQRRRDRLVSMQEAQQRANEMMFQSPIGHTRM
jgi:endonuclease YncB( thermonuclease family)